MRWLAQRSPGPRPVLDAAYLCRLEAHLGEALVAELLADGLLELGDRLERLATLAAEDERAACAALVHDLIATAGHLGLSALSVAAAEMQRQIRTPTGPDITAAAAPVLALGPPSLNALEHHLTSLRAR